MRETPTTTMLAALEGAVLLPLVFLLCSILLLATRQALHISYNTLAAMLYHNHSQQRSRRRAMMLRKTHWTVHKNSSGRELVVHSTTNDTLDLSICGDESAELNDTDLAFISTLNDDYLLGKGVAGGKSSHDTVQEGALRLRESTIESISSGSSIDDTDDGEFAEISSLFNNIPRSHLTIPDPYVSLKQIRDVNYDDVVYGDISDEYNHVDVDDVMDIDNDNDDSYADNSHSYCYTNDYYEVSLVSKDEPIIKVANGGTGTANSELEFSRNTSFNSTFSSQYHKCESINSPMSINSDMIDSIYDDPLTLNAHNIKNYTHNNYHSSLSLSPSVIQQNHFENPHDGDNSKLPIPSIIGFTNSNFIQNYVCTLENEPIDEHEDANSAETGTKKNNGRRNNIKISNAYGYSSSSELEPPSSAVTASSSSMESDATNINSNDIQKHFTNRSSSLSLDAKLESDAENKELEKDDAESSSSDSSSPLSSSSYSSSDSESTRNAIEKENEVPYPTIQVKKEALSDSPSPSSTALDPPTPLNTISSLRRVKLSQRSINTDNIINGSRTRRSAKFINTTNITGNSPKVTRDINISEITRDINMMIEKKNITNDKAIVKNDVKPAVRSTRSSKLTKPVKHLKPGRPTKLVKGKVDEEIKFSNNVKEGIRINVEPDVDIDPDVKSEKQVKRAKSPKSMKTLKKKKSKHVLVDKNGPFICEDCGKQFPRKSNHDSHIRLHLKVKPHVCQFCSKAFVRRSDLNRHERSLHLKTTFKCYGKGKGRSKWGCGHLYSRKDGLRKHWKSSQGTKCLVDFLKANRLIGKYNATKDIDTIIELTQI